MTRNSSRRCAMWQRSTGFLLVLFLGSLNACAQEDVLTNCVKPVVAGAGSYQIKLCLKPENGKLVWVKAEDGKGFRAMAHACCNGSEFVETRWTNRYTRPLDGKWYPVALTLLAPNLSSRVLSLSERNRGADQGTPHPNLDQAQGTGKGSEEPEPRNEGPGTTSDLSTNFASDKNQEHERGSGAGEKGAADSSQGQGISRSLLLLGWVICGVLFLSLYGINIFIVLRLRDQEERLASFKASAEGREDAVATLAGALRQALQEKIIVELAPPTNPEWESLLLRLWQALRDGAPLANPNGKPVDEKKSRPPATLQFGAAPGAAKVDQQRRYVHREMNYNAAASKNFGGELAFQETSSNWSPFYVEVDSYGNGLLYVNPSAQEYDALYDRLFGLEQNQFPFKGSVAPKPKQVKRDGQRWVLESTAW